MHQISHDEATHFRRRYDISFSFIHFDAVNSGTSGMMLCYCGRPLAGPALLNIKAPAA